MSTPDDETLRRLASGEAPLSDEATYAAWCAAEVLRLRAIIEGRTTPPTEAEIEAHHAAGGAWLIRTTEGWYYRLRITPQTLALSVTPETWWALDAQRRPCPWPRVKP